MLPVSVFVNWIPRSGSGGRAIYDWTSGGTAFAQKTGPLGRQLILGLTQPVRLYGAHFQEKKYRWPQGLQGAGQAPTLWLAPSPELAGELGKMGGDLTRVQGVEAGGFGGNFSGKG